MSSDDAAEASSSKQSTETTAPSRSELIAQARSFLHSPQVLHQDDEAKRKFLAAKGLTEDEIVPLLQDRPIQSLAIPPRTYPQPPPSNLPNLLIGIVRILSWVAGGSAFLVFVYHRLLLPRITRTYMARHSLHVHQKSLMQNLTASLGTLRDAQISTASSLPRPNVSKEYGPYAQCLTITDILAESNTQDGQLHTIPPISLLRCGIADFTRENKEGPTTEQLFTLLESQIPWLTTEKGVLFEHKLWETLSTRPVFQSSDNGEDAVSQWSYTMPQPPPPSALVTSLSALLDAVPKDVAKKPKLYQHTLQSLSDLTGYISSNVYVPYRLLGNPPGSTNNKTPSLEEDLKKEIRALKGLVLTRRSFMPSPASARPTSYGT